MEAIYYFWYFHSLNEHRPRVTARVLHHVLLDVHRIIGEIIMQLEIVDDPV